MQGYRVEYPGSEGTVPPREQGRTHKLEGGLETEVGGHNKGFLVLSEIFMTCKD